MAVVSLRSDYNRHVCAPYLGVIRKRKPVSKKEFIARVVLVCLLNFLLQIWYVGNAGDFIANYVTRCRSLGRKHVRGFAIIAHVFAPHIWKLGVIYLPH